MFDELRRVGDTLFGCDELEPCTTVCDFGEILFGTGDFELTVVADDEADDEALVDTVEGGGGGG